VEEIEIDISINIPYMMMCSRFDPCLVAAFFDLQRMRWLKKIEELKREKGGMRQEERIESRIISNKIPFMSRMSLFRPS
jgi:hypothetical protein